jgi:hypothetical protein
VTRSRRRAWPWERGLARASPSSSTISQRRRGVGEPERHLAHGTVDPGPDRRRGVVVEQVEVGEDFGESGFGYVPVGAGTDLAHRHSLPGRAAFEHGEDAV